MVDAGLLSYLDGPATVAAAQDCSEQSAADGGFLLKHRSFGRAQGWARRPLALYCANGVKALTALGVWLV